MQIKRVAVIGPKRMAKAVAESFIKNGVSADFGESEFEFYCKNVDGITPNLLVVCVTRTFQEARVFVNSRLDKKQAMVALVPKSFPKKYVAQFKKSGFVDLLYPPVNSQKVATLLEMLGHASE